MNDLVFKIDSPVFMRCEPKLPKLVADVIFSEVQKITKEYEIKDQSDDLSPYLCPWVMAVRDEFKTLLRKHINHDFEIDWSYSATLSMLDILLQAVHILDMDRPKIYVDGFDGLWNIRQLDLLTDLTCTRVTDIRTADIVVLTHAIPEEGTTSLATLDLKNMKQDAILLLDAAQFWTTLLIPPWNSMICDLLEKNRCAIVGDFHKLMGYGIQASSNITVPISLSLNIYSNSFFRQRMAMAEEPVLEKDPRQQAHWNLIYTRKIINGISTMQIIFPLAFLRLYNDVLPQLTQDALDVAKELRKLFDAEGDMTFVTKKITQHRIAQNKVNASFLLEGEGYSILNEDVVPIVFKNNEPWGFIQVYIIMALMGKENLRKYYVNVCNHFFL